MSTRVRPVLPGMAIFVVAFLVVALLAVPVTTSHAGAPDGAELPVITLTATDYAFEAPETLPSGAVTIRLVNQGEELHHAQLIRIDDGKTLEDLAAAAEQGDVDPAWADYVGGPGLVAPGMTTEATVELRPGTYYWTCFIETSDGTPHMAKGMVHRVVVEPGPREPMPEATNTLMLNDYDFKFGNPLEAGRQVIRVRNYAAQPHEVMIVKLEPGKTMEDMMAWIEGGEQGPPPGVPLGGMQALSQGLAGSLTLDLEPGDYGLICFIPDATDGQPHFVHGMMDQVTVD